MAAYGEFSVAAVSSGHFIERRGQALVGAG
jgi:hypothetical protein